MAGRQTAIFHEVLDIVESLPENQQEELIQEFFEKADSVVKAQIKDAQRKGIDIFTSPLVSSPFKVFLVANGF